MKQADLLNKAIRLRHSGHSFREIAESLNISKSTASLWLRDLKIDAEAKSRIISLGNEGRLRSVITSKKKRQARQQSVASKTINFKRDLVEYSIDQCKLLLAMLYWGEGAKTLNRLDFINSDAALIKTYLFLLRKCFKINEQKLTATIHIHEYHDKVKVIDFWSGVTKINKSQFHIYKKPNTAKRKKADYQGCLSLRYSDVNMFDEVMLIIERFQKSIK